ncbi:hypothetical protein ON010_g17678 [Phytophthora cinnamomi]|nr:hypothetical protein ON010_g17678 [Phytophthora cinnamomi]
MHAFIVAQPPPKPLQHQQPQDALMVVDNHQLQICSAFNGWPQPPQDPKHHGAAATLMELMAAIGEETPATHLPVSSASASPSPVREQVDCAEIEARLQEAQGDAYDPQGAEGGAGEGDRGAAGQTRGDQAPGTHAAGRGDQAIPRPSSGERRAARIDPGAPCGGAGESFLYIPPIGYYFYQSDTLTPSLACASLQTCHSRKRARAARCPAAASVIRPTSRPPRCGLVGGGLGRSLMVTVVPSVAALVAGMSPLAPDRSASPPATPLLDASAALLASPLATANLDASLGAASPAAPAASLGVSPAAPTVGPASPARAPSDLDSEFGEEDERMWEAIVRDSQQPDFAVSSPVPSSRASSPLASPPASPAFPGGAVVAGPAASGGLSPVSCLQELIFELEVEGWSRDEMTAAATGEDGSTSTAEPVADDQASPEAGMGLFDDSDDEEDRPTK